MLEPQELKEESENIIENKNEIFKIDIIKKYQNKIDNYSEIHFSINFINNNAVIYFKNNQ